MPLPPQLATLLARTGHLGWIGPKQRTRAQHDANARHLAAMPRFRIGAPGDPVYTAPSDPIKVMLTDSWKDPSVIADIGLGGQPFPRFHQLTGSCVGCGGGQALATLNFVQRMLSANPTTAFVPFWPYNYGKCRAEEGDVGQGEGAMGSSFAHSIATDGILTDTDQGLPVFVNNDGLILTDQLEMQWSDGNSSLVTGFDALAKPHPVGTAAPCLGVQDVKAAILNGYPCTCACDDYIGNASIQGTGGNACVLGKWDSPGGHQQSVHNYWDHPTLGPLYWAQNNWPGDTYPADPAGGPTCGCWVRENDLAKVWQLDAEVFAISHLSWFPAQPSVWNWFL